MLKTTFVVLNLSLAAVLVGCADEPVPAEPSFAADVRPIFMSRCVRCHGAGGTLNVDPLSKVPGAPELVYLEHYEDTGDCTMNSTCMRGAKGNAALINAYVHAPEGTPIHMPPAPAESLSDRQLEIIARWAAQMPPKP